MILVLTERATPDQVAEMLKPFGTYIKLAVDVEARDGGRRRRVAL